MPEHVRMFSENHSNNPKAHLQARVPDVKTNVLAGHIPLSIGVGKGNTASNADAHTIALNQVMTRQSTHPEHLLLQLQRQYGNRYVQKMVKETRKNHREAEVIANMELPITNRPTALLARFPAPADCDVFRPGLSYINPVIKDGYDGKAFTAIKSNWGLSSWQRRWQIYDPDDQLLYESYYTWPQPTLYIPKEVVDKGKAYGIKKPWSVWLKVTKTLVPFGGSDPKNFPHAYMKFYVYNTWDEYMADPTAKLSASEKLTEPSKTTTLEAATVSGSRSVMDYGSVVAMHEAYLREIYDTAAKGITETAKEAVTKGVPQGEVAKWANEARNQLKAKIRADGNPILKKVFEARNLNKYGDKLGPTYEQLRQKYAKQGLSPEEINKKIIGSSGKANLKINRWSGRLKIAGRIILAIDIALAGVRIYLSPEGQKNKVALEEIARIGGALALGAAGVKAGAAAGAAIGALFGGVGSVPGAIIGGLVGGLAGVIVGGLLGKWLINKLYEMFPPADCVFEGEFVEEER